MRDFTTGVNPFGALGAASATPDLAKSAVDGPVQFALRGVLGLLPNARHHPTQFFSRGQRLAQLAHFSLERSTRVTS
jgi:hypothetical protein